MIADGPNPIPEDEAEDHPPIFRSWRSWYAVIILELFLLVVLFRVITVVFG